MEGTKQKMSTKPAGVRSRRPRAASTYNGLACVDSSVFIASAIADTADITDVVITDVVDGSTIDIDASTSPVSAPGPDPDDSVARGGGAARQRRSRSAIPVPMSSAMRTTGERALTTSRIP